MESVSLYRPIFGAVTLLVLMLLLRGTRRLWLPAEARARADDADGTVNKPNHAMSVLQCGNVVGLALIAGAVVEGGAQQHGAWVDACWVGIFGLSSSLLLLAGGRWGVRMILRASLPVEIGHGNLAAGIVAAAHMVATAIILSKCIYGADFKTLGISLGFFVLAQLTLHLFVIGFRAVTTYDDAEEIRNENVAAALSYAGMTIALGIIIARATDGAFTTWMGSLSAYGRSLLFALFLYPVRPLVVQGLLMRGPWQLRGGSLDRAIAQSRDVGVGLLEGCSYLGTALVLARMG